MFQKYSKTKTSVLHLKCVLDYCKKKSYKCFLFIAYVGSLNGSVLFYTFSMVDYCDFSIVATGERDFFQIAKIELALYFFTINKHEINFKENKFSSMLFKNSIFYIYS